MPIPTASTFDYFNRGPPFLLNQKKAYNETVRQIFPMLSMYILLVPRDEIIRFLYKSEQPRSIFLS